MIKDKEWSNHKDDIIINIQCNHHCCLSIKNVIILELNCKQGYSPLF